MSTTDENPGLVTSIIERSFAIAKVKKQQELLIENINQAIQENNQISNSNKEKTKEYQKQLKK